MAASEMLVYGFHPVREALRRRPEGLRRVLVARSADRRRREIEALCRRHGVRLERTSSAELDRLASGTHNGLAAELHLDALAAGTAEGADAELAVLLEDLQDPRNLGALLRVCEGAGVGRVLIRDRGSAPLSATVTRTSAGAAEWLDVERVSNAANALERLKEEGFWVYGAAAEGEPVWQVDLTGKVVFCFGGEEKGLRSLTRKRCDRLVALPMAGRVESLNVATAAAAILFEARRQRSGRDGSVEK
jgi:23S rRNA (guanosine2251-2'-O)-methyltransferase